MLNLRGLLFAVWTAVAEIPALQLIPLERLEV